ncbi:MAG: hypothetical protein GY860_17190 [Desulfobacteraceae bacterium]|nr:hypothetical protein [Desulfobacteraceae bacterium]
MTKDKILCWYGKDPFKAGKILMESSGIWKNWSLADHIGLKLRCQIGLGDKKTNPGKIKKN